MCEFRSPNDYAVVVGINVYPNLRGRDLSGAVADAEEFRRWLVRPDGGGLNPAHVFPDPGQPIRNSSSTQIRELINQMLGQSTGRKSIGNRLYLFLAGHGLGRDVNDARLIGTEHSTTCYDDFGALAYADVFASARLFAEVLVFMDCCRDEELGLSEKPYVHRNFRSDPAGSSVPRAYGLAAGLHHKSREHDFTTGEFRGVFSTALLEGLSGTAADDHGHISTTYLWEFLRWRVPDLHPDKSQNPHKTLWDEFHLVSVPCPTGKTRVTVTLRRPELGLVVRRPLDPNPTLRFPTAGAKVTFDLTSPLPYQFHTAARAGPRTGVKPRNVLISGKEQDVELP